MNDDLKNKIIQLRNSSSFDFRSDIAEKLVDEYSLFRRKSHLVELRNVTLASLKDGDLKVFEGAPGAGKSKVIHIYSLLGLMEQKNIIISCNNYQSSKKMAVFVRKLAKHFDLGYRNKIKYLKFKELREFVPPENTVILIDEAGFLPLDVMNDIIDNSIRSKSLLILVGDLFQIGLKPENNGFLQVIDVLHNNGNETRELKEIFRQRNRSDVKAIHNIRKGQIKQAFNYYYRRRDYKSLAFFDNKKIIIEQLLKDIDKNSKDSLIIASNYRLQKHIKSEFEERGILIPVLTPKEAQGMAVSSAFFVFSQKTIEISELLVAFSRHKYKIRIYIDNSFIKNGIEGLVESVKK